MQALSCLIPSIQHNPHRSDTQKKSSEPCRIAPIVVGIRHAALSARCRRRLHRVARMATSGVDRRRPPWSTTVVSAAEAASAACQRPLSPIEQAVALRQRGQFADAERILRGILASEPSQRDAQHLLGLVCHQRGRHVEALQLVGAASQVLRARRSCSTIMASSLPRSSVIRRRFGTLRTRSRSAPNNLAALRNRAGALKRLQRFDQALAAYEAVLALNPNDVDALNECGGLLTVAQPPGRSRGVLRTSACRRSRHCRTAHQ